MNSASASDKKKRVALFLEKYSSTRECCAICPRRCAVNRSLKADRVDGDLSLRPVGHHGLGRCGEPWEPRISSSNLHHGEEPPVSGTNGSGTVFFTGCNMNCAYCQNFPISQQHQAGRQVTTRELADVMLSLQARGAHNINFVTPSHYVYQAVEAVGYALDGGLAIPIVYNTSGYDRPDVMRDLEGIVDVWLPDAKYADPAVSKKYSNVGDYFEYNGPSLKEMYRQAGENLDLDENGIARKGLIIRHLVLPGNTDNSKKVLEWIRRNLSAGVHLSIMAQYFPAHRVNADCLPELNRRITPREYDEVLDFAEDQGFSNAWFQEYDS